MEHNKHCLVQNPFMETSEQAAEIFALAKEKGLIVQAYQNRYFDSDFLTVQKVIEEGKLGDLLEVEMHYNYFRPEVPESADSFDPDASFLYGHGFHALDQVISYFGKPNDIHYDVKQLPGPGRMNDYFDLDLYYGRVYDDLYEAILNGKDKTITEEQTLLQIEMLEAGIKGLK